MSNPAQLGTGIFPDFTVSHDSFLQKSAEIWRTAVRDHPPYATVAMVSGGNDSICMLTVALTLGIHIDFIGHVKTGTGSDLTTEHVQRIARLANIPLLLEDAGDTYERYVEKNGFFGVGSRSHSVAFHILKKAFFQRMISQNIRHRKRNRTVLMISGARVSESQRRKVNISNPIQVQSNIKSNVWVALNHDWCKEDVNSWLTEWDKGFLSFRQNVLGTLAGLGGSPLARVQRKMLSKQLNVVDSWRNPVSVAIGRSAECMCGTMQCERDYRQLKAYDPKWGERMDALRERIRARHGWDWGEDMSSAAKAKKSRSKQIGLGQMELSLFSCLSCVDEYEQRVQASEDMVAWFDEYQEQ